MDSPATLVLPLALLIVLPGMCTPTHAEKPFRGPVQAKVVEILDGDTFVAEATVWPGHTVRVNVRIRGIDAPEMKARCPAERRAAEEARRALAALLRDGMAVVSNIAGAKYYGRVLADVATADGREVAPFLLGERLVRPYGGGRRAPWCD